MWLRVLGWAMLFCVAAAVFSPPAAGSDVSRASRPRVVCDAESTAAHAGDTSASLSALSSSKGTPATRSHTRSEAATATAPSDPSPAEQAAIYFPPEQSARVRTIKSDGAILCTDAPVDAKLMTALLDQTRAILADLLPPNARDGNEQPRPVCLALYRTAEAYKSLWPRVAKRYGGAFGDVTAAGFSYRVFCAGWWGSAEDFAARRAVLAHEFAHVWLFQNRALANDGNWLTEGLGALIQLRLNPASGDRKAFARLAAAGKMLPLKRLMDQDRVSANDYWQAATLVETIARHYPGKLPQVIAARARGDSAYAIVTRALDSDFPTLEKHWISDIRQAATTATSPTAAPGM